MGSKKSETEWKELKFRVNLWFYLNKLKVYADDHDMSVRATIKYIIHEFFKDKSY